MKGQQIPAPGNIKHVKEKKVIIFDSCQFTVRGLTLLCERHAGWRMCGTDGSFSALQQLLLQDRVDMVLCGIGNQQGDFARLLNLPAHQVGRCVLLTDKSSTILRGTFLTAGFDAVASKQLPLNALDGLLYYTMYFPREQTAAGSKGTVYLPQEREVLSALLKGDDPHRIAKRMGISYRTVSRYKHSGLKRAGVKSLNEIMLCQKRYAPNNGSVLF